jgi:hypothetical protein
MNEEHQEFTPQERAAINVIDRILRGERPLDDPEVFADIRDAITAVNNEQFDVMAKEIKRHVEVNHRLRAALLPFAAAAGRPGRLTDSMTDQPLPDDVTLALGVKVSAWKNAIDLTGAD